MNTGTTWKKKGGNLRAASMSSRFLTSIDDDKAKLSTAKATADIDRLTVYQYLTDNLGIDEDKNFVYDRFADGAPASKQECARRLFRLLAQSKKASRQAAYSYEQKQCADLAGRTPRRMRLRKRRLPHIWNERGSSVANCGWKIGCVIWAAFRLF